MYLYLYLIVLFVCLLISLRVTRCDILAPCNVFLITYSIVTLVASFFSEQWEFELHFNTFVVLILGTIIFLAVSLFVRAPNKTIVFDRGLMNVANYKIVCLVVLDIVLVILTYYNIHKVASPDLTITEVGKILYRYRQFSIANPRYSFPLYISVSSKITEIACYYFIICYANNLFHDRTSIKKNRKYLYLAVIEVIRTLETGARAGILNIAVAVIVCLYLFMYRRDKARVRVKLIVKYLIYGSAFVVAFCYLAFFLGRNISNGSLIKYMTVYVGAELRTLDYFMQQVPQTKAIYASETLYSLNSFLGKIGVIDLPSGYSVHMDSVRIGGFSYGNVYTAYRRWYSDFGILGVVIFQSLFSLFFCVLYSRIIRQKLKNIRLLVIYMQFSNALFQHFFDDKLFRNIISVSFIIYLCIINILYYWLMIKKQHYT